MQNPSQNNVWGCHKNNPKLHACDTKLKSEINAVSKNWKCRV